MAWPFPRKRAPDAQPAPGRPVEPPRPDGADTALVDEIQAWLKTNAPRWTVAQTDPTTLQLGNAPGRPAAAALKVKRGKLALVDVWDPAARPDIDALVKQLDRQQKWSFNGVVRSHYPDEE